MEPKAEMGSVYPVGDGANGSLPGPRGGATVVRMVLGAQLRRLREAAGLTPEQAGYEIRASRSKMRVWVVSSAPRTTTFWSTSSRT